jgi:hypothetical protein
MKRTTAKFELRRTTLQQLSKVGGGIWPTCRCYGSYDDGCSGSCNTCEEDQTCFTVNGCSNGTGCMPDYSVGWEC